MLTLLVHRAPAVPAARARAVDLQRRLRTAGMLALEAELHRTNGEPERAIEAWQQVLANCGYRSLLRAPASFLG